MESFLLANHISAISDQPYYFVRTRTEGRNTSRLGQPPEDNLTKNLNVIAVVERRTEPGDRRNELLVRSFTFGPGLTRSFQAEFLELGEPERRRLVDHADGAAHLWNDYLRERSEPWKRAVLEAVFTRDYSEVDQLARTHGEPLALELDPESRRVSIHRSTTGRLTHGYRPALAGSLVGHELMGETLRTQVRWQLPGVSEPPDQVAVVWRHREAHVEHRFLADDLGTDPGSVTLRTELGALSKHGSSGMRSSRSAGARSRSASGSDIASRSPTIRAVWDFRHVASSSSPSTGTSSPELQDGPVGSLSAIARSAWSRSCPAGSRRCCSSKTPSRAPPTRRSMSPSARSAARGRSGEFTASRSDGLDVPVPGAAPAPTHRDRRPR